MEGEEREREKGGGREEEKKGKDEEKKGSVEISVKI